MSANILHFDAALQLPNFELEIAERIALEGVTAVFGPSGGGKTTFLRLISGLTRPDRGIIRFADQTWCDLQSNAFVPPHRRAVGMVFQDQRLLPHLSVQGNLNYARRRARERSSAFDFDAVVDVLDLGELLKRRSIDLSGGERQRVAIGRALLTQPDLLLLDEPLSALDRGRRSAILTLLRSLPSRLGAPVVMVSHDLDDVCRIADQVVLLSEGRIEAVGPTVDVLNRFAGQRSAGLSAGAILEGRVASRDATKSLVAVEVEGCLIQTPLENMVIPGSHVRLHIDAKDVVVATRPPSDLSIRNTLPATIERITPQGEPGFVLVSLQIGAQTLRAEITKHAAEDLSLEAGQDVFALVKTARLKR
ncbi:MAG: molybdenum ABC transporter ATP-binding protein [Pseudomonadota bacterium]